MNASSSQPELKITIIVPVYNVEEYLETCLLSLVEQTYQNVEILVIDDGSTDGSTKICEKFAHEFPRIRFHRQSNGGLGHARNVGVTLAKGKYILFVDSDDFLRTNTVERLLDEIRDNDILIFNGNSFAHDTNVFSDLPYFLLTPEKVKHEVSNGNFDSVITVVSACLKIYRTDFIREHRLAFPTGVYGEDVVFWMECLIRTKKITYLKLFAYCRRVRAGSITYPGSTKNLTDRLLGSQRLLEITSVNHSLYNFASSYIFYYWRKVYETGDTKALRVSSKAMRSVRFRRFRTRIKKFIYCLNIKAFLRFVP